MSNKSGAGDQTEHKSTDKLLSDCWKVWRRQVYCQTLRQWCGEMIHCHIYLRLCPPPIPLNYVPKSVVEDMMRDYFAAMATVEEGDWPNTNDELSAFMGKPWPGQGSWSEQLKYRAEFEAKVRGIKADAMLAER